MKPMNTIFVVLFKIEYFHTFVQHNIIISCFLCNKTYILPIRVMIIGIKCYVL